MAQTVSAGTLDEFPETSIQRCLDFAWHQRYPQPKPPADRKDEVFKPERYKELDKKAQQLSIDMVRTVQDLVIKLTTGLKSDIEKVRAIFTWLGHQKILSMDMSKVGKHDIIRGYLKIVRDDRSTFTELMAMLCREANIPCVVLAGPAKGAQYDVGDGKDWRSSWNAVYVAKGWRFIHPQWAYCKIVGRENSDWLKLETNEKRVFEEVQKTSGKEKEVIDEFFFLTDPEVFINFCCPDDPKWQLIKIKISTERFWLLPYIHPNAIVNGFTFKRSQDGILKTENGECRTFVTANPDSKPELSYELHWKMDGFTDPSNLNGNESLVIKSNMQPDGLITFFVRCTSVGEHRLRVCMDREGKQSWLCDFMIYCDSPKSECHVLPTLSEIGWGPGPITSLAGLRSFSHLDGYIIAHDSKVVDVTFKMSRTLAFHAQLKHYVLPDSDLIHSVKLTNRHDLVIVTVTLQNDGEFVLMINARRESDKDSEWKNILNYVIESDPAQRKYKGRDNPPQKKARQEMREAIRTGNKTRLGIAIERFRKTNGEDRNDLTRAMESLDYLQTLDDLKFAMMKNRYEQLREAIGKAQSSQHAERFQTIVMTAIEQKDKLQDQIPVQTAPLDMTSRTIADLKSYKKPPSLVHDVLKATYLLLGENEVMLDTWSYVRSLLHKTGRDSLILRLQKDPLFDPKDESMLATEQKAKDILTQYEVNAVGKMSPAGEAVYIKALGLIEKRQAARLEAESTMTDNVNGNTEPTQVAAN